MIVGQFNLGCCQVKTGDLSIIAAQRGIDVVAL